MDLPHAEAVFDISFFRSNPIPFYTLARELYPGKYRPTISHSFIRLLAKKGLLLKLFTQNIDCLDREAGVPEDKIVEAHGSFATQSCIECGSSFPEEAMKEAIEDQEVPQCQIPQCNGLVKPDIVFFGEQLPANFHNNRWLPETADLCIVMGTSLTVQPFASLPGFCPEGVPRLLINMERVGGLGSRADDVLLLGDCDAGVKRLAEALGWLDDLEALWALTKLEDDEETLREPSVEKSKDEEIEDRVASLTEQIDKSLKLSEDHSKSVKQQLGEPSVRSLESPTKTAKFGALTNAPTYVGPQATHIRQYRIGGMEVSSKVPAPSKTIDEEATGRILDEKPPKSST